MQGISIPPPEPHVASVASLFSHHYCLPLEESSSQMPMTFNKRFHFCMILCARRHETVDLCFVIQEVILMFDFQIFF